MKKTLYLLSLVLSFGAYAQSGINTKTPKVTLQVNATNTNGTTPEGIIAPRMTGEALHQADINNVYRAAQDGAIVFVTSAPVQNHRVNQTVDIDSKGYYYFNSTENKWIKVSPTVISAQVGSLDCEEKQYSDTFFVQNKPYTGTLTLPYTNGNNQEYPYSTFVSNGLTFTLPSGKLENGEGDLIYHISGTPTTSGQFSVPLNFGDQSCTVNYNVANIGDLDCSLSEFIPATIYKDTAYNGTLSVRYTNGNGVTYPAHSFSVYGLTFNLPSGTLSNGPGTLTYNVTGTPIISGPIAITFEFAGKVCTTTLMIRKISSISCEDFTTVPLTGGYEPPSGQYLLIPYPSLYNQVAPNTTLSIRYLGGDGTPYPEGDPITVGGLTFVRRAGTLAQGAGTLIYDVTGTPTQLSIEVPIEFYGLNCTFYVGLQDDQHVAIKGRIWKRHNLGADTSVHPDYGTGTEQAPVIVAELHGNYYQWGRRSPVANDTTPYNILDIWHTSFPAADSWSDKTRTVNDPCPKDFKVPSKNDADHLVSNTNLYNIGESTWTNSNTNYHNAKVFSLSNNSNLILTIPTAGFRHYNGGPLQYRGIYGYIWLSNTIGLNAYMIYSKQSEVIIAPTDSGLYGLSVRCVSVQ